MKNKKNNSKESWRIFRIMAEFVDGFEFLDNIEDAVVIWGSARISENNHWYKEAEKLGRILAESGYTVITGGGPGIM
ncbi:MAG: TIGR00730 family Rossman fold protein, partial [bacterium]|nr:TIGR00730 family Rossman fold protein [bacterium]